MHILIVALAVQDAQDGQEQVDNIQVEGDGRSNLFLDMIMAHNQLRIDKNVSAEDQRRKASVNGLRHASHREESSHEAEQDEEPQGPKQIRHPACKVIFGLAGKEGEGDEKAHRDEERLYHDPGVVERSHDADGVAFEDCECAEKEEIGGVALALPVGEEHEDEGTDDRD